MPAHACSSVVQYRCENRPQSLIFERLVMSKLQLCVSRKLSPRSLGDNLLHRVFTTQHHTNSTSRKRRGKVLVTLMYSSQ